MVIRIVPGDSPPALLPLLFSSSSLSPPPPRITVMKEWRGAVVVRFLEYGNEEEVQLCTLQPLVRTKVGQIENFIFWW